LRDEYVTSLKYLPSQYDQTSYVVRTDGSEATTMSALAFMNGVYPKALTGVQFYPTGQETFTDEDVQNVMESEYLKDKSTPVTGTQDLKAFGTFPMMEIEKVGTDCTGLKH
jgi:hypothetical protein